jgi:hypothetical protein
VTDTTYPNSQQPASWSAWIPTAVQGAGTYRATIKKTGPTAADNASYELDLECLNAGNGVTGPTQIIRIIDG